MPPVSTSRARRGVAAHRMLSAGHFASIETCFARPETGPQSRARIHFRQLFTPSLCIFVPGKRNIALRFCSASKTENYSSRSSSKLFRLAEKKAEKLCPPANALLLAGFSVDSRSPKCSFAVDTEINGFLMCPPQQQSYALSAPITGSLSNSRGGRHETESTAKHLAIGRDVRLNLLGRLGARAKYHELRNHRHRR